VRPRFLPLLLLLSACTQGGRPPTLEEGLSVEQPGGGATKLLSGGDQLPASATEAFVTAKDDETRLFVHVLRGVNKKAAALRDEGWWQIDGLTRAPAGVTRAHVTFEVDGKQQVTVLAREDDKKLKVVRLDEKPAKVAAARLSEPDDEEDGDDEE
jgi:molecular chaperone DnaK (HSP70)